MWVLKGRLVPMSKDASTGGDEEAVFSGRVWIGDDGRIAAVTRGSKAGPPEFLGAPQVDVGTSLVMPGLIDLHNHLAYNTLPLWAEPSQSVAFKHHDSWTRAATYATSTTWPAYAMITACPQELLAYVETKAVVGGTTSVQGSPPQNRPRDGWLVRNIEDESFGTADRNMIYASTLTAKPPVLAQRANGMRNGSSFIYHCAEGQKDSLVAREWADASRAGCLQPAFIAVHANAVDPAVFTDWASPGGVAWSPLSNLWLYGQTTDVPAARAAGVTVSLGSDWAPSGTKHVLGEVKVARLVSDDRDWGLRDADLVRMVTCNPGDLLNRAWGRQIGRLQPGAIADVVVVAAKSRAHAFHTIVKATEADIRLVVIDGRPRYGVPDLMAAAGADPVTPLDVAGEQRLLALSQPDDPTTAWRWQDVVDRMEQVRADPKGEIQAAQGRLAAWAGQLDHPDAPLRLALDMPTGLAPVGGLPKDLTEVVVPPLQSLTHDQDWLASLSGRGFHDGLLDGLVTYYA